MLEITSITDVMPLVTDLHAIIFDLDDTLYGEKEYVWSGYCAVAKILPQIKNAEQKLWTLFEAKKNAIDELLRSENIYSDELKMKCLNEYRYHKPDIHLYDGVSDLLVKFRDSEYKLGIITDGRPEGQRAKIKSLQLEQYIDHIIVTDELGGVEFRKPNPAAFVQMRDKLNISFDKMCYIGDNIKKDFIAPVSLGMKAIHFLNKDGLYYNS